MSGMREEDCMAGQSLETLAREAIELAGKHSLTLGTAESCTGGMVAAALTSVPGASEVYKGSVVSYANEVKVGLLGVDGNTLADKGAVSEEVALQMAVGARWALGVDFALSTTGIAGPGGGSESKPVGTVWIAVAGHGGEHTSLCHFAGNRDQIREAAARVALQKLSDSIQNTLG